MKKTLLPVLIKHQKLFFLFLVIACGFFLLWDSTQFQSFLAQGDHGRDLYAFEQTLNGAKPYQDYWWVYGPLMPYYYSLWLKLLGINIQSVLIGKFLLTLLTGTVFYLALSILIPHYLAFIAAIWFWQPNFFFAQATASATTLPIEDFFYTYNHSGGLLMLMALIYFLFKYIKDRQTSSLYYALIFISILCLIKINFGLAALATFTISIAALDFKNKDCSSKKLFYLLSLILIPTTIFVIYWSFLKGLPFYAIRQCQPYLSADHPYNTTILTSLSFLLRWLANDFNANWQNKTFIALFILCFLQTFYLLIKKKSSFSLKNNYLAALLILLAFAVTFLHEFLFSSVFYRSFWAKPFNIAILFIIFTCGTRNMSKTIKFLLAGCLIFIPIAKFATQNTIINKTKTLQSYLPFKKGQIYVGNRPQWIKTVTQSTFYLSKNLKNNETFFSLPYDPLYYFLTDKKSPTRQTIFFEHINIPKEQELKIINELETQNINYVLLSSRMRSAEHKMGLLGKTHCPLLTKYLEIHFKVEKVFGDWKNPAGWAWNHGTMVLKRTSTLKPAN